MYLCLCKAVTESDVKRAAQAGTTTAEALIVALGLDGDDCCGRCAQEMDDFVAVAVSEWVKVRSAGL